MSVEQQLRGHPDQPLEVDPDPANRDHLDHVEQQDQIPRPAKFIDGLPRLRRQAEELHRRGPRPVGEILLELVGRWGPAFEADLGQRLDRYLRIPAAVYRAVGASEYSPAPIHAVVDLDDDEVAT